VAIMNEVRFGRQATGLRFFSVLVAILVLGALSGLLGGVRVDLSRGKANSLSPAFRKLVTELPQELSLTYILSPRLSERHPGPDAVSALLASMESIPGSRISLRIVDPARESLDPSTMGLVPRSITTRNGDEQSVTTVWSGIFLQGSGRSASIPFILDEGNLEADLLKVIRKVAYGADPLLAVLVGDADRSLGTDYRLLSSTLSEALWEIIELRPGDPIPAEAGVLLVLGGSALGGTDAARIEGFIKSGGRVFFALQCRIFSGSMVSSLAPPSSWMPRHSRCPMRKRLWIRLAPPTAERGMERSSISSTRIG
jgi:hypothetical protein